MAISIEDRSATITIVDHNFDAKDVVATVTAQDAQGEVFDLQDICPTTGGQLMVILIKLQLPFGNHYTLISYKDLAGNDAADYATVALP